MIKLSFQIKLFQLILDVTCGKAAHPFKIIPPEIFLRGNRFAFLSLHGHIVFSLFFIHVAVMILMQLEKFKSQISHLIILLIFEGHIKSFEIIKGHHKLLLSIIYFQSIVKNGTTKYLIDLP